MTALSNALRHYVRVHDIRIAKAFYRQLVTPMYRLSGVPVYDITASYSLGYTWFRIPKNGTHSILEFLSAGGTPEVNSSYVPYFKKSHTHQFRFCFVRNPWDRLVSVYCNKVQMKLMFPSCWDKDFDYFIKFISKQNLTRCDAHMRLQTALFPASDVDFAGRMENFQRDLEFVGKTLGIDGIVPHEGKVEHEDYRAFYSASLADKVAKMYQSDIEFGKYRF